MAYETMIGNFLLISLKGHVDSEGNIDILGMYVNIPKSLPESIFA
jgi:hypothetical protein